MDTPDLQAKIFQIIRDKLKIPEERIVLDAKLDEDFGADSLDQLELIMAFEDAFDIEIPDEDAEKIKTVGQAVDYIKENI